MRFYCLQHEAHEGPGIIATWCYMHGHTLKVGNFASGDPLPGTEDLDGLFIMGGGMSVNDESRFPWLIEEKRFIEKCVHGGKIILGICLGAQLIASIFGSSVYPNPEKEIGWFPIELTAEGRRSAFFRGCPATFPVFHWHGETFDLPGGAILLTSSRATRRLAFQIGDRILGLQFHMEVDGDLLSRFIASGKHELVKAQFVQTEEEIRDGFHFLTELSRRMSSLLDMYFFSPP
jgi:GMP synthase-like glutamine amidotransferase